MKTILVTGTSGFLGERTAAYLEKQGYRVIAPSHREMELTDMEAVRAVFWWEKPQAVIHCAAVSDVGQCQREPERSWQINVAGSQNLVRAAGELGAKYVLCSSDQVYVGSSVYGAHSEDEALAPGNVYGREKLEMEESCLALNPDCVCLRLSWMYDAVRPKAAGDFISRLVSSVREERKADYSVMALRGITNVELVAQAMEKALAFPGGVYNFGSPNEQGMYDTVREIFDTLGLDQSLVGKAEPSAEKVSSLSMDISRIRKLGVDFPDTAIEAARCLKEALRKL